MPVKESRDDAQIRHRRDGAFRGRSAAAARGIYKVTRQLPVENDNRILYRVKNPAESFERTAEEHQLSRAG